MHYLTQHLACSHLTARTAVHTSDPFCTPTPHDFHDFHESSTSDTFQLPTCSNPLGGNSWPGHDCSQGSEVRSHRFLSLQAVQKSKLSQHLPAAILRAPSPVPSVPMVQICSKCTRHVETWMFAPKILPKSPRENK